MVVLVERQTDQRQVISIRASHQDRVSECTLPLHRTPRDGSLLCLRESVSGKGQPVHGSHIKQAQAGAHTNHVAGTSKMRLEIPRTLSAKHETCKTGGRQAGNQRIKAGVLEHVNNRNHKTTTLALENGTALSGPNSWPDAQA